MAKDASYTELELIRSIRQRALRSGRSDAAVALGIGDDCAVVRPPKGHEVLVTTDFSLEGKHFRRDWHPGRSAGHRCLARGLSDLAAMGAKPLAAFLSLAVPAEMIRRADGRAWLNDFLDGLFRLSDRVGVVIAGGDTAGAPGAEMLADIVLLGSAPRGTALRRSGARVGDAIYVTGHLGGAAAELDALAKQPRRFKRVEWSEDEGHPHLFPSPRLRVGEMLRRRGIASAAIDVSDGLSTDLRHLCEESAVDAEIEVAALPVHPLAVAYGIDEALRMALHGGEDYELLFTAAAKTRVPRNVDGVSVTRIGTMVAPRLRTKRKMMLIHGNGRREVLHAGGWEHLS